MLKHKLLKTICRLAASQPVVVDQAEKSQSLLMIITKS